MVGVWIQIQQLWISRRERKLFWGQVGSVVVVIRMQPLGISPTRLVLKGLNLLSVIEKQVEVSGRRVVETSVVQRQEGQIQALKTLSSHHNQYKIFQFY